MRDLAKACEMGAGTLYHYFGSKGELLYLIINTATSKQREVIETCGRNLSGLSATDALTELIRTLFRWHHENQDVTLFIYQETKNLPKEAQQTIFDSERRIIDVFEQILKSGIESGEFKTNDVSLIAHNIIVLGHAWALRRWYLAKHWSFESYVEAQTQGILKSIGAEYRKWVGSG